MRGKKGIVLILAGLVLIVAAFVLHRRNTAQAEEAAAFVQEMTPQIVGAIDERQKAPEVALPQFIIDQGPDPNRPMPIETIGGHDYIGMLCIPSLELELPILGICRGIQILNVCLGGSLYQDIPAQYDTQVKHSMEKPYIRTCHDCLVTPGTPLAAWTGQDVIQVNSHHHQSVKKVAPGLAVMGTCSDGIVEALYKPDARFLCAVQWHPEKIWQIEETSAKVFEAFIAACKA